MKLDTKAMRHLTGEDWRVLTAVEQGSKNHEIVPTTLIERMSHLHGGKGGVGRCISNLAKNGLIARVKEAKYDGYRLTYGGLDYLALHTYASKKEIYSTGTRVGVGKESDIMIVADSKGVQKILKIHRLGRISFRSVKTNRDYLRNNKGSGSWMYLSRLAAMKEFAFMKALKAEGFPVPDPIAQSRHTILMSLIDAHPMRQIASVPDPASLYGDLIDLLLRLAKHGLIHGDYNEFNILIKEERRRKGTGEIIEAGLGASEEPTEDEEIKLTPVVIDFPQMVSMDHVNAEMYFDRDVNCIKRFFQRRYHFTPTTPGPFFKDAKKTLGRDGAKRLDAEVFASGFTKKMLKDLEAAIREQESKKEEEGVGHETGSEEEDDDEDEDDEDDSADEKTGDGRPRPLFEDDTVLAVGEPETDKLEKLSISET